MRDIVRRASPIARVLLVLAAAFLLVTCVSLCKRAWRGDTDFSVFYRAAVSLAAGAGGEIYKERDGATGWYNCIPPAGMVAFMGLSFFHRLTAGILWAVVNLGLLAACFAFLQRIYARMGVGRVHYEATLPYAVVSLAVFGGVCLQTGQTSILFVTCWLGYVYATTLGSASFAGLLLAAPAAIKLYPLIFGLVPLLRKKWAEASWGMLWLAVLTIAIPAFVFRENFMELTSSFFSFQVLNPDGRVMTAAAPTAMSNQGIDAVLLRFLSYVPGFHDQPGVVVRGGNFEAGFVLTVANVLRVCVVLFTAFVSVKWLRTENDEPPFLLVALWCAALYMILPGAKARYAIYALPAILAMFAAAHREYAMGFTRHGARLAALSIVTCGLLLQIVPVFLLQFGVGYIGTLILWLFTVREAWETGALPRRAGENYASRSKRATNIL